MLNLAVIGCGRMASDLARRCVRLERARITAIHDTDAEAMDRACAEFGAEPEREIAALAHRADIDAFLVGSPPYYHYDNVMAVARCGKPVYSEKPLCTTVDRCDAMITECRRAGTKLFVGQVLRLFPLFWKSHEIIRDDLVGEPRAVSITRAGRGKHFRGTWRSSVRDSGGVLLEVNSHELDYMLFLLGEADTVFASGADLNHWGDYPDTMFVQIRFRSGAFGFLHSSNASPVGEFRVHIQCSNGNILHGGFGGELRWQSFDDDEPTVVTREDIAGIQDPYDRELISFFDWVEKDEPPLFTGETGRANVAVAEAAYRSMRTGKPEPVPPVPS